MKRLGTATHGDEFYSQSEVAPLLDAYRRLFPLRELTEEIRGYWGLNRPTHRPWALLCTDFHTADPTKLGEFDRHLHSLHFHESPCDAAKQLQHAVNEYGVGCSIGISPWTDYLLHKTFDPTTTNRI